MKFAIFFATCCFFLLAGSFARAEVLPTNTIMENLFEMPDYSILARLLSNYSTMSKVRDMLNSTDSNVTLMAPNNLAIINEVHMLDDLLQKSGYPPLRTLFPKDSEAHMDDAANDEEFFSAVLAGAIPLQTAEDDENVELASVDDYGKLPKNIGNITDGIIRYYQTCMTYHIVDGNWSTTNFTAGHEFLTTMADNKTWVGLGGKNKQMMHVENLTSSSTMFADENLQSSGAPAVVILFGGASDPISADMRNRIRGSQFSTATNTTAPENYMAKMIRTDVGCNNGIIQGISKVVELPMNASTVMWEANLLSFLEACNSSGALPDIQDHDNITLFIPANMNLMSQNQTEIRNLIRDHVMHGAWYPTSLRDNLTIDNEFTDASVTCKTNGANGMTIGGSKILRSGYLLRNGCAYLIDQPFSRNETKTHKNTATHHNSAMGRLSTGMWSATAAASVAALMWV